MEWESKNTPQGDPTFHEKVQKEKLASWQNNVQNSVLDEEAVHSYLKNLDWEISYETIRKLLESLGNKTMSPEKRADSYLPSIAKDSTDTLVVSEVKKNFELLPLKERTPEALAQIIADYIKLNMKYDVITLIGKLGDIERSIKFECESLTTTLKEIWVSVPPDKLKMYLAGEINKKEFLSQTLTWQSYIWLSNEQMGQLTTLREKNGEKFKQVSKGDDRKVVDQLESAIKHQDKQAVINVLRSNPFLTESLIYIQVEGKDKRTLNLNGEFSMYQLLKEIKVWVCRHYSIIAKELFEQCASSIAWEKDSELVYVLNTQYSHAYNVLMKEESDWSISKKYLDITNYVQGQKLRTDENVIYWWNGELYVENTAEDTDASNAMKSA